MAIERTYAAIGTVALTATGTTDGVLTLASTLGVKVGMRGLITGPSLPDLSVQVKRVDSTTILEVGAPGTPITNRIDVSAYTAACFLTIPEQSRPTIPLNEIARAVYEEEPTVATRVVLVDQYGNPYVASGGSGASSVTIKDGSTSNLLEVYSDGSIKSVQLFNEPYDSIGVTYPFTNVEVYTSYVGGLSGATQQIVTVTYTDSTKMTLTSVVRT